MILPCPFPPPSCCFKTDSYYPISFIFISCRSGIIPLKIFSIRIPPLNIRNILQRILGNRYFTSLYSILIGYFQFYVPYRIVGRQRAVYIDISVQSFIRYYINIHPGNLPFIGCSLCLPKFINVINPRHLNRDLR